MKNKEIKDRVGRVFLVMNVRTYLMDSLQVASEDNPKRQNKL